MRRCSHACGLVVCGWLGTATLLLGPARPLGAQANRPAPAETASAGATSPSPLEVARKATVFIEVVGVEGAASGSGFIVAPTGTIVTNAHVIHGASAAKVKLPTGEVYDVAGVLDYDERLDLAILAVAGFGLPTMPLGDSDSVTVGQRLIGIGAPLGLETTVSDGLLSASRIENGTKLFQISVPVSHGSSGGPIITEDGRVVGVVASGISGEVGQNLNFAVPINYVRGKLAMIGSKAPTPLSDVRYGAGPVARGNQVLVGDDGISAGAPAAIGASPMKRLNTDLHPDWESISGLTYRIYEKGDGQIRFIRNLRYGVTKDPNGTLVIERYD